MWLSVRIRESFGDYKDFGTTTREWWQTKDRMLEEEWTWRFRLGLSWPTMMRVGACIDVYLPLWIPLVIVGSGTGLLWYFDRRTPIGNCSVCGYNLTGNTSRVCSECGTPISNGTDSRKILDSA